MKKNKNILESKIAFNQFKAHFKEYISNSKIKAYTDYEDGYEILVIYPTRMNTKEIYRINSIIFNDII